MKDPDTYLLAIDLMLDIIDERLPDDSMAPKPYEVSITEMRDLRRLARKQTPLTVAGRAAMARARDAA
jgi:hypothetical protein